MCNLGSYTISEINRQQSEIARINALNNNRNCGNCGEFTEDQAFFVFGKCALDDVDKSRKSICEAWKPRD